MKKSVWRRICRVATVVVFFFIPYLAGAQPIQDGFEIAKNIGEGDLGTAPLEDIIVNLINVFLGFIGIIFIIIIQWGGVRWMFSGGNEENVGSARRTLLSGFIGITIILFAFSIMQFVITSLSESTGGTVTF